MAVQIKAALPRCAKLLVISCTMLLFLQQIRGQSNYVDFLKKSNDALALKILSALAESHSDQTTNILFSPSSILTGIGMLYSGMDGETKENVRKIMGFPSNIKTYTNGFVALTKNATDPATNPKFVANMITVNKANKIKSSYALKVKKIFNGNPYHEDFSANPDKTRKNINAWVAKRTNKKIKELLPQGGVKAETLVVLVNVLYFKDEWLDEPFLNEPFDDTFKLGNGETVTTKFMEADDIKIGYKELKDVEIVSLPFKNNDYSMVVVAPKNDSDPETILKKMHTDSGLVIMEYVTNRGTTGLRPEEQSVRLSMPLFKTGFKKNLADIMGTIGLSEVMASSANFGKLSEKPVRVDAINHKAVIDVNTKGVEAAAATAISIVPKIGNFPAEKEIILDRPFLYFLVQHSNQIVHFAGILRDPTAEDSDA